VFIDKALINVVWIIKGSQWDSFRLCCRFRKIFNFHLAHYYLPHTGLPHLFQTHSELGASDGRVIDDIDHSPLAKTETS